MIEYCDFNNDGTIEACEAFDCIVIVENQWRAEYCPEYGLLYCENPFVCNVCEGAWNCDDIYYISEEFLMAYDTNNDG